MATSTIQKYPVYQSVANNIAGATITANSTKDINTGVKPPSQYMLITPALWTVQMINFWIDTSGYLNVTLYNNSSTDRTLPNWAHLNVLYV